MSLIWEMLLSLLFPREPVCLICGLNIPSGDMLLCTECERNVFQNPIPLCSHCGSPQIEGCICSGCSRHRYPFSAALSSGHYEGSLKKLIHGFKYRGFREVSRLLGALLLETVRKINLPPLDFIIPVPLHPRREYQRGFNQSLLLAKEVSQGMGVPLHLGLVKIKDTEQQTFLDKIHREKNLQGAFEVRRREELKGKRVLLIDDVFTTGATARACAKALIEAGVQEVLVLTVACG